MRKGDSLRFRVSWRESGLALAIYVAHWDWRPRFYNEHDDHGFHNVGATWLCFSVWSSGWASDPARHQ